MNIFEGDIIGHCGGKHLYEHVCNSECLLTIEPFECTNIKAL